MRREQSAARKKERDMDQSRDMDHVTSQLPGREGRDRERERERESEISEQLAREARDQEQGREEERKGGRECACPSSFTKSSFAPRLISSSACTCNERRTHNSTLLLRQRCAVPPVDHDTAQSVPVQMWQR